MGCGRVEGAKLELAAGVTHTRTRNIGGPALLSPRIYLCTPMACFFPLGIGKDDANSARCQACYVLALGGLRLSNFDASSQDLNLHLVGTLVVSKLLI